MTRKPRFGVRNESGWYHPTSCNRDCNSTLRLGTTYFFLKWKIRSGAARPRSSGKLFSGCTPYRHPKCLCRCHYIDTTFIHGRENPGVQQNNKVCRRVGSRTTSRRYAGSNHEYGPSLLASHFHWLIRRSWRKVI